MFSKIKKTGSSTMNESLRLKMKKHKNYGLCLTQIITFSYHPKPMKLKSPKIPKTAPTHHPLYQLQHKVSTYNFLKS